MGTSIKSKFTDTNDQIIDAYIQVRPEVAKAIGRVARGGASMDSRANAARAVGILRGREAIPDLEQALRSKDSQVIYESLIALQKIRDRRRAELRLPAARSGREGPGCGDRNHRPAGRSRGDQRSARHSGPLQHE